MILVIFKIGSIKCVNFKWFLINERQNKKCAVFLCNLYSNEFRLEF